MDRPHSVGKIDYQMETRMKRYKYLSRRMRPELCIPRMEATVSRSYIKDIFTRLDIGKIERIIEIPLRSEPNYKRIIIQVDWKEETPNSVFIQDRLSKKESVKLVHDMPWFWRVVTAERQGQQQQQ